MKIIYKNKEIIVPVKKVSGLGKITGLMFKRKSTKNLLFEFKGKTKINLHSCFVFFDFISIWLDEKNKVVEWKHVRPFVFHIKPKKDFIKIVEIPLNKKNNKIVESFVDKGKI